VNADKANITEYIQENFGANATYVEGLLSRYQADPKSVDESWQTFFAEMLSGGGSSENGVQATTTTAPVKAVPVNEKPAAQTKPQPSVTIPQDAEARPITGPSKKIVENMEQSLTVPTATSLRNIPVKILEENRRIINGRLGASGRGKVSFTHLIGWAIVKAAKAYPHMNYGFGLVNGVPSRVENNHINLGLAIDIEKKDGSRSLLVPNIKATEQMNFAEFFAAYNDTVKRSRDGKL